jgi:hypothetical protein
MIQHIPNPGSYRILEKSKSAFMTTCKLGVLSKVWASNVWANDMTHLIQITNDDGQFELEASEKLDKDPSLKSLRLFRRLTISFGCVSLFLLVLLASIISCLLQNPFIVQDLLANPFGITPSKLIWLDQSSPNTENVFIPVEQLNKDQVVKSIHSHNDYLRQTPLFDALKLGINSVEADVWFLPSKLMDSDPNYQDNLYVGHHSYLLTQQKTLHNLYLAPIMDLLDEINQYNKSVVQDFKRGVFFEDPVRSLYLHIDLKNTPDAIFDILEKKLAPFKEKGYLTVYDSQREEWRSGPLTIVVTGKIPFEQIEAQVERTMFIDAPLELLLRDEMEFSSRFSSTNSIFSSASLKRLTGSGKALNKHSNELSEGQLNAITTAIQRAHALGLKVRIWDTPSWPISDMHNVWRQLVNVGVDLLNVDDLARATTEQW